ncbi:paraquat-inducible protein A [Tenacibaculum aquimarinum]|uniref:paraquat-inducible protein A n=1 Tax=Tenacibaculum aquimarinum TaxID=2910675 RepID=UPI001F0AA7C4|nr:paraquat-inducible protein A [Tenacibaculum aquimarinum]MCH3882084.1 paraquat-inducible protein A [Tenacibaculum aquimarinum]
MKHLKTPLLFILLLSSIYFSINIYKNERINQSVKNDLIELSKIKYGLFNVDEWKTILTDIISDKVESFNLKDYDRAKMKVKISSLLHSAISEYQKVFKKKHPIKNIFYRGFTAFKDLREEVPMFTEQILDFLDEKQNRENLKKYINNLIDDYADETFSKTDYSIVNSINKKYNYSNKAIAIKELKHKLYNQNERLLIDKLVLLISFILIILLLQFSNKLTKIDISLSLFICLILLFLGVTLPMIEIDARISKMDFTLLGNNISFKNQVLFYKSKSIIEVVYLMISQSKIGIISVGLLVLIFSVVFPIIKILSSFIWTFNIALRNNKIINFFVHKSGKWSMADVFVIAILMSYIGFDGIINDQLSQLERISTSFNILTTNQSNLMFGFFAFTGFVILGIFISQKLKSIIEK